jgi:hypothetical protein
MKFLHALQFIATGVLPVDIRRSSIANSAAHLPNPIFEEADIPWREETDEPKGS